MADPILKPVSTLNPAAALTGAELVPVVQGGVSVRATAQAIADLAAAAAPAPAGAAAWRPPPIPSNMWWLPQVLTFASLSTAVPPAAADYSAFVVDRQITLTQLGAEVTAAATGSVTIAVYDAGSNGLPNNRLGITSALSTATTGLKSEAVSITLAPGVYWLGVAVTGTPTMRVISVAGQPVIGRDASLSTTLVTKLQDATGSLPDPAASLTPGSASWLVLVHAKYT